MSLFEILGNQAISTFWQLYGMYQCGMDGTQSACGKKSTNRNRISEQKWLMPSFHKVLFANFYKLCIILMTWCHMFIIVQIGNVLNVTDAPLPHHYHQQLTLQHCSKYLVYGCWRPLLALQEKWTAIHVIISKMIKYLDDIFVIHATTVTK